MGIIPWTPSNLIGIYKSMKTLLTYRELLERQESIKGGKADGLDLEQVAKAHGQKVTPQLELEFRIGQEVEREHTSTQTQANEIALDHLREDPMYYTKLIQTGVVDEPKALKLFAKGRIMNEMWDTNPDIKIVSEKITNGENYTLEFEIDGFLYSVYIIARRNDEDPKKVSLEMHFSSKNSSGEYTSDLTGRGNMQKVMGGVWMAFLKWAKEVAKGGYLTTLIISSKSEKSGDDRRAKIYADFLARKAAQVGMKIKGSEDITDVYNELSTAFGGSAVESITHKYMVEDFPIAKLKSLN